MSRKLFQSPFVVGWFVFCNSFAFMFQKEKKKSFNELQMVVVLAGCVTDNALGFKTII